MANVITSSSKRLISSSNQGKIQRVLVESENGKALFLESWKSTLYSAHEKPCKCWTYYGFI